MAECVDDSRGPGQMPGSRVPESDLSRMLRLERRGRPYLNPYTAADLVRMGLRPVQIRGVGEG